MSTRREFLQSVAAIATAGSLIPDSIQRALAIEPEPGSSVFDAEHVVILMQENRSFDHAFGSLQGVRGFNDPHPVIQPDGNPVWVQATADGKRYVPFRLDIKKSNTTWLGCLPHGWSDQVDATNGGRHDRWLQVKKSGKYPAMPLTLGYHTREDLPFYYALADAFTICDQNFCSTLTGTTPNRLHLWTGTCRAKPDATSPALVRNEDCDYGTWCNWTTFPERLEDAGVSWKIYQNELTVPTGLSGEAESWLSNFGDSPLEWFTQFNVRSHPLHQKHLKTEKHEDAFDKLPPREKSLHQRAFTTNSGEPAYRELTELEYKDGDATRKMKVPKGDVLHQFRKDVAAGTLPTVSWIVPPEKFSDHPCTAWYGQWYLSEVMNILTQNPKVWQKTVFILTYDENDGYFDHVPPFQAPHPEKPESGKASAGLDTTLDHQELDVDRKQHPKSSNRGNSLGLGYRVPMIIASPWSRGGAVCSQVFDHTSVIRFLETLLTKKTGRKLEEPNITAWRRAICGDLTSAFQSAADSKLGLTQFVKRDEYLEAIHKAQRQPLPGGFHALSPQEITTAAKTPKTSVLPRQEPGVRKSAPLPYELSADAVIKEKAVTLTLAAGTNVFGPRSAGAAMIAYAFTANGVQVRHNAMAPGHSVEDAWPLELFDKGDYRVRIHGPNGFFREFQGSDRVADLKVTVEPAGAKTPSGDLVVHIDNENAMGRDVTVRDRTTNTTTTLTVAAQDVGKHTLPSAKTGGWYDAVVECDGAKWHYAGRVETGRWSITDPAMA